MNLIHMKPVTGSSQIASYAFDPATGVFSAMFHNSAFRYDHQGVTVEDVAKFEAAESKGRAYNAIIKPYAFNKIDTADDSDPEDRGADAEMPLRDGTTLQPSKNWPFPASSPKAV